MTKIKDEIERIHRDIHKIILSSDIKNKYRLIPKVTDCFIPFIAGFSIRIESQLLNLKFSTAN